MSLKNYLLVFWLTPKGCDPELRSTFGRLQLPCAQVPQFTLSLAKQQMDRYSP